MKRRYEVLLNAHFKEDGQMAFLSGPRQVGKTTTSRSFHRGACYFNWDNEDDRRLILEGPAAVVGKIGLSGSRTLIFDELHKYRHWKNFIKGFYDTYAGEQYQIVVTGSARLDLYRKGADSLMGRYFMYRMHPLSVAEVIDPELPRQEISAPARIDDDNFAALVKFGGFPEAYLKRNSRFFNRWKRLRRQLLFREDLRNTTRIYEVGQVELLAELLRQQVGQLVNFAALSRKIRASQDSIRRWLSALESLYYCFTIRPWSRNLSRSLLKDPKIYLWDWSTVVEGGARNENFIASHLLKAVHWWTDSGLGDYGLYFLRTKDKREVDFLVTRDDKPWFLVEAKSSADRSPSRNLDYFQTRTGAEHAFEVVMNAEYEEADCFAISHPVQVPARTLLSQLV